MFFLSLKKFINEEFLNIDNKLKNLSIEENKKYNDLLAAVNNKDVVEYKTILKESRSGAVPGRSLSGWRSLCPPARRPRPGRPDRGRNPGPGLSARTGPGECGHCRSGGDYQLLHRPGLRLFRQLAACGD